MEIQKLSYRLIWNLHLQINTLYGDLKFWIFPVRKMRNETIDIETAHYRRSHRSIKIVLVGIVGDVEVIRMKKLDYSYCISIPLMVVAVICHTIFHLLFSVGQTSLRSFPASAIPIFDF